MNQFFPESPPELIWAAAIVAAILLIASVYFWWSGRTPKPKKDVTDALFELSTRADAIVKEPVNGTVDEVFYERKVKAWMEDALKLLNDNVNTEEVHMFTTFRQCLPEMKKLTFVD